MSNNGSEVPLASYPVDEPVINLGRSDHNTCHIRLFDRWCSDIHCKLIFEEGKVRARCHKYCTPAQRGLTPRFVGIPCCSRSEWCSYRWLRRYAIHERGLSYHGATYQWFRMAHLQTAFHIPISAQRPTCKAHGNTSQKVAEIAAHVNDQCRPALDTLCTKNPG